MKQINWRRQHKISGLAFCLFMLVFAISGLMLNHRTMYSRVNIGRAHLPEQYHFKNWNNGLLRGTEATTDGKVVIYGSGGIWLHSHGETSDFNQGLPYYADYRITRNVITLPGDSSLVAATQYGIYRRTASDNQWHEMPGIELHRHERFTDVSHLGDTLIVASRSRLFISMPPYTEFRQIDLPKPVGFDGKVSLFRVVWLLHSGQFFGIPGKVVVELMAIGIIILCITGILYWLLPKYIRRRAAAKQKAPKPIISTLKLSLKWHRTLGVWGFVLMLIVVISGWALRPPLLIPLALNKMPGIHGTELSPEKPWNDKLRAIRYDDQFGDWIISTSDGFFSIDRSFSSAPKPINGAPAVSVMGVNVFQRDASGSWIIGSLSGMTKWDRTANRVYDYFTGEQVGTKAGPPFGKKPVAGYSSHFDKPIIAEYYDGTPDLPQPQQLESLPMSAWQLALELHTGRFYNLFGLAPLIWIFIAGAMALWVLISGWKVRKPQSKKQL